MHNKYKIKIENLDTKVTFECEVLADDFAQALREVSKLRPLSVEEEYKSK